MRRRFVEAVSAIVVQVACTVSLIAGGSSPALAQGDLAQSYPRQVVKLIVPYPPGNFSDSVARIVFNRIQASTGWTFIVENRRGAGGIAATEAVVRSPADGHTLLVGDAQQWAITPLAFKNLSFDVKKDLVPVGMLVTTSLFFAAHESVKASNLHEVVALAKKEPGKYAYGTPGNASLHHLLMETFAAVSDTKLLHVPYRGSPQALVALTAGEISLGFQSLPSLKSGVEQGKLNIHAVAAAKRFPLAPDIPTFAELGYPAVDLPGPLGIFAPAGTPKPIIDKLAAVMREAVMHPESLDRFRSLSIEPVGSSPEEFARVMDRDFPKFVQAAKYADLNPE